MCSVSAKKSKRSLAIIIEFRLFAKFETNRGFYFEFYQSKLFVNSFTRPLTEANLKNRRNLKEGGETGMKKGIREQSGNH